MKKLAIPPNQTRNLKYYDQIAQTIHQLSDDLPRVEEGSLYPALQRLELNGWICGEWGLSADNPRARFYKLTPDGRKQLTEKGAATGG